jgi:hypothetical protein
LFPFFANPEKIIQGLFAASKGLSYSHNLFKPGRSPIALRKIPNCAATILGPEGKSNRAEIIIPNTAQNPPKLAENNT